MTNKSWFRLALLCLFSAFIFTACCGKKPVVSEPAVAPVTGETEAARLAAEREARAKQEALEKKRIEEERLREEAGARKEREEVAARQNFVNEHIYFEFDKSRLLPEAKEILRKKGQWLKANPEVSVIIEGHCDERGTNEYNMALGDRRATSAKTYLVDLGIAADRLTCISYGEERPADQGHNEAAWARNRRDQFVIR